MKKILAVLVFVLLGTITYAQWNTSGDNIYNTNTGNVGIGITTPTEKLHVFKPDTPANILAESPVDAATNRTIAKFMMKNPTTTEIYQFALRRIAGQVQCVTNAYVPSIGTWADISLFNFATRKLITQWGVGEIEYLNSGNFLLNNVGSVGIGTGTVAIPSDVKLAVNGKVNCKEVEVTLSGWSDFVFKNDYKLRSLAEVENFINLNGHLPDVPSENDVLTNGANLGKMDAILLQKIEELTLYMIDLKKENDLLKERINNITK